MTPFDWSSATTARLVFPDEESGNEPHGEVEWTLEGSTVIAQVDALDWAIRVTGFRIESANPVPMSLRRLPGDSMVFEALRGLGDAGMTVVSYLLQERDGLSREIQDLIREGSDYGSALETVMKAYMAEVAKRPRARITSQVAEVNEMLDQGTRTRVIVERLKTRGLSESTAYRRLAAAKLRE